MTVAELRRRGVLEIGRIDSFLYVRAERGLCLFHAQLTAEHLSTRDLDAYGVARGRELADEWGITPAAERFGMNDESFRDQLVASGWIDPSRRGASQKTRRAREREMSC